MERTMTPHRIVNPPSLAEPVGFAHAVVAAPGRTIWLGGQTGHDADGNLQGATLVEQFDRAAANVVEALRAAGGEVDQLVSMQLFVTDAAEYRASLTELGDVWRRWFGRHYPAVALFEVSGLFDPAALVEIVAVAVVPDTAEPA
jgi:enamine deaminase RidA (YjgF/YER057c/UK114 family)